jgi:phosphohistidine phosphatase
VRVLLVRHAIAAERGVFPGEDRERPLTSAGRRRFRRGARGISAHVPELALIVTSPLLRARQTAEILRQAHPEHPEVVVMDGLAPAGRTASVLRYLNDRRDLGTIALVGHEPGLSRLEGLMLAGRPESLAELRKGGAALVEFRGAVRGGGGSLLWHLTAGLARELEP